MTGRQDAYNRQRALVKAVAHMRTLKVLNCNWHS
jgi:hypothetical protein